jgi:dephospho-CoA kinase
MKTRVLALTGAPAVGKSTVVAMLEDMGVPCKGTGDAVRELAADQYDDPDEDDVWSVAADLRDTYGPAGPTVACREWIESTSVDHDLLCVSDCRTNEEIEWLREHIGPTIVVEIRAPDVDRAERYVDMHIDEDRTHVSQDRVRELKQELWEREHREGPYPTHDVIVENANSTPTQAIYSRFERITGFVLGDDSMDRST